MAGVYIHIPFCRQACHYCNFHFATSLRYKDELISAIVKEATLQKDYLEGETVETIYFGGGTPSLLPATEIQLILAEIKRLFPVGENPEITLEANPDDITEEKLEAWQRSGINRLSIGVQSFFEEDLRWMNRAHTSGQALENVQLARRYFENITIDLIYGTPGLTNERWKENVNKALELQVPHLSCYALTVEPKTPLAKLIRRKEYADTNPDVQSEQFLLLMQWLDNAGFEHYEISNFARPGWRSRHNASYWAADSTRTGKSYLGLGPSAHSYNGKERQWNVSNNTTYIQVIGQGRVPYEKEILTAAQQLNEYIMTSLRTIEGLNLELLKSRFQLDGKEIIKKAQRFIDAGEIEKLGNALVLTRKGKLLADGIAAALFF